MTTQPITDLCRIKKLLAQINRLERRLRSQFQVTLNESLCLCCLSKYDFTAGDLAKELGLSNSRLSRVLNSLERKSLITRSFAEGDRRMIRLQLTKDGVAALALLKNAGYTFPAILHSNARRTTSPTGGTHG